MEDGVNVRTAVRVSAHDGVALLVVDSPPVNAIDRGVADALENALAEAGRDPAIRAVVIMGGGRTFTAGADISTLERMAWGELGAPPDLHRLLAAIEDSPKPVVIAIHGTALGGGLELAMAGHFRIAAPTAILGQPEVNLGIIPGAEGTVRLPRLVGTQKALEMCVTGKPIKAREALAAGLLDAVVDGDLAEAALAFARDAAGRGTVRTRDRSERLGTPEANAPLFASARELAGRTRRRQVAPLKAVDSIEAATTLPFEEAIRRERELFSECIATEQAKGLIHLFFAERAVSKIRSLSSEVVPRDIARVAVVGAGTMGGGIAAACANAGLAVTMKESSQEALDRGIAAVRRTYESSVSRGRLTADAAAERMARLTPQLSYDGFADADIIIEAVFESLELKKQIFRELDGIAKPSAVLATNTSTLDIDRIAAGTGRPGSIAGLHFFSPAHVMRLLEVVRGAATSPDVLATAIAFAKRLGKVPVVVANCPGFVGNRMMFPYMYEAQFLVEEGATPEQVDRALTGFGMAMGIFAVDDMAGIDVAWRVRQELGHLNAPGERRPLVADKLYELGRFGQKTGAGWYSYDERRTPSPDPVVLDLIRRTAAEAGIPQRTFTDEEIVERCLYALINEGARVVEDGSAERASDIDVIYANGYGFPAWRGGPMFWADRTGIAVILDRVARFHRELGERWAPAPLLARLAREGRTFRDLDRSGG
jgi:3-hydroxyacyl-CoA dehydrogenase